MEILLGALVVSGILICIPLFKNEKPVVNVDVDVPPVPEPERVDYKLIEDYVNKAIKEKAPEAPPKPDEKKTADQGLEKRPMSVEDNKPSLPNPKDDRLEDLCRRLIDIQYGSAEPGNIEDMYIEKENILLRIKRLLRYMDQSRRVDEPQEGVKPVPSAPRPII